MDGFYNPAQSGFNDGADFILNGGYVLGGTYDPSSIPTQGAKGAIWIQVAQYGIGAVNIFQKQDDGKTTNWVSIIGGGGSILTGRDKFTLTLLDIANGYLDLSQLVYHPSVIVTIEGASGNLIEGVAEDFTLLDGVTTRVIFSPGVLALLTAGQKVQVQFLY